MARPAGKHEGGSIEQPAPAKNVNFSSEVIKSLIVKFESFIIRSL